MSPDGQTIVTGAGDETLRFWNVFAKSKSFKVLIFIKVMVFVIIIIIDFSFCCFQKPSSPLDMASYVRWMVDLPFFLLSWINNLIFNLLYHKLLLITLCSFEFYNFFFDLIIDFKKLMIIIYYNFFLIFYSIFIISNSYTFYNVFTFANFFYLKMYL